MKNVPVYLFNGFLESGKTKFIQETLEDERFSPNESVLVIVCEEGEIEYNEAKTKRKNLKIVYATEEDEFTEQFLLNLDKEFKPDNIIVEFNGMWLSEKLFSIMPENWNIAQVMTFFDSTTFLVYNQNMRQQVFDKISITDLVVFNRFDSSYDKQAFHKVVRSITRRTDILYEDKSGVVVRDDIVDPLPYDLNSKVVKIQDIDYAYFYRDISEEAKKYENKVVEFVGVIAKTSKMPLDSVLVGRHIMTCCEADISFSPLVGIGKIDKSWDRKWVKITATIKIEKHQMYKTLGPVLHIDSIEETQKPEQEVATFY